MSDKAERENRTQLARLGGELRAARRRRRLSQAAVGERCGLHQTTVSRIERGFGDRLSIATLQRVALAVGRPLRLQLERDVVGDPVDAGHLAIQEVLLRFARSAGFAGSFELPTRASDPRRSIDVALRDDRRRLLLVVEAWNTIDDIGAARRSFVRKLAEAEALAVAIGQGNRYRITGCWVVRSIARNRSLVARYPEVFAAAFPGSSAGWASALTSGAEPPTLPGLVWCDPRAGRLIPWRRRGAGVPKRLRDTPARNSPPRQDPA